MVKLFWRNGITVAMLCVLLLIMSVAGSVFQRDWRYFAIEKQVNSWRIESPPSPNELEQLARRIHPLVEGNPNLLRIYALALEWKALLDTNNQRFHLYGAEESLQQAVALRPTDSRAWAHLALIKSKLYRDTSVIHACYEKAKRLGAGDRQTTVILKRVIMG